MDAQGEEGTAHQGHGEDTEESVEVRDKDNERRVQSGCRCMRVRAIRNFRHVLVHSIYFTYPQTEAREVT